MKHQNAFRGITLFRWLVPLIALVCLGCQSTPPSPKVNGLGTRPKSIIAVIKPATYPFEVAEPSYLIQLLVENVDGRKSRLNLLHSVNEWGETSDIPEIYGFRYATRVLIDDEMVEIDFEPGMRSVMKIIPYDEKHVRLKGLYTFNPERSKKYELPATVIPFNAIVEIGEPTWIYEIDLKYQPSQQLSHR